MNTIGTSLRLGIYGESHGRCVGALVDGFPVGVPIEPEQLQVHLDRRRPGLSAIASARSEPDRVEILSGLFGGRTSGAPILLQISNRDADPRPYEAIRDVPRPGHADFTFRHRYRGYNDHRGGGHASGRLTAAMVAAGALAHVALSANGVEVVAQTVRVGDVEAPADAPYERRFDSPARCGDGPTAARMVDAILEARRQQDSVGGVIRCRVDGLPIGVGEPLFDSIEAVIAHAMMSIPAARGVEFGLGFAAAKMRGSQHNDPYVLRDGAVSLASNHAGGAIGGLSNGMPFEFAVAFKPTPSIARAQASVDLARGVPTELRVVGRHDPCIVPRAVPVVECLTAFMLLDLLLRAGAWRIGEVDEAAESDADRMRGTPPRAMKS